MKERCNHDWEEKDNKLVCKKCNTDRLKLEKTKHDGLQVGITDRGRTYSVRDYRNRFFFPEEWSKFYEALPNKSKPIFDVLINTGARIEEALNIVPDDFKDEGRKTLTLRVTKKKAAKQERVGKQRTFAISSQFYKRCKKYIEENHIGKKDKMFTTKSNTVWSMLRRRLKKQGVEDYYNFSLHNIRKTHGMWLKSLKIPMEEICFRLGHDFDTYQKHYGSPDIFDGKHKRLMLNILGDVYNLN